MNLLVPSARFSALLHALHNLKASIEESGATITFDELPSVAIQLIQLEQIFHNLLSNAIKYRTKTPPLIHIGVQRKGDDVIFSVADNGIGIDHAYADHIFGLLSACILPENFLARYGAGNLPEYCRALWRSYLVPLHRWGGIDVLFQRPRRRRSQ